MYFSVLIQLKAQPRPTKRLIESNGMELPKRHIIAPISWQIFDMLMIIDQ
jgi:hypothetical protein